MSVPTGTATLYYNSNVTVATATLDSSGNFSGSGTVSISAGQYQFTIGYSGDDNFNPSTSLPQTVTVADSAKQNSQAAFTMPSSIQDGIPFTFSGSITAA